MDCGWLRTDEPLVLFMKADPEPNDAVRRLDAERTMRETNSDRPILADTLELQGRMTRIDFEEFEILAASF